MNIAAPAPQAAVTLTLEAATKAFADWETAYRAQPETFYTPEEVAAMEVATLSQASALHFLALLRNQA